MATAKLLLGAALAVGGGMALAQESGTQTPPAPPAPAAGGQTERQVPPADRGVGVQVEAGRNGVNVQTGRRVEGQVDVNRGVQVEGQVGVDRAAAPRSFHRASQVLGSKVSIEGGLAIGTVQDVVFADDGMVEFVIVANEGKLVSVPWAASKFDFRARTATVAITQDRFHQIPTFTAESYPDFDAQYVTRTYSAYGVPAARGNVNAHEERKIDRAERKVDRKIDKANRRP